MALARHDGCSGLIDDEKFEPITVVEDGVEKTYQLPVHVAFPPSRFEPIGLAPSACTHGLKRHPNPEVQNDPKLNRLGPSWIRSRYLDPNPNRACPVCRGEPRPDDLTLGYVDPA